MKSYIERVESAIHDLHQGKMILLTDNPSRENEADLIFPAEKTTPEMISFMLSHTSGIICLPLTKDCAKRLNLPLMLPEDKNTSCRGTPFTISIDAREGITTGVSAEDRTKTILAVVNDNAKAEDLVKPGHMFPLIAKEHGVLERAGHTEGAIDLVRLAGFKPAAVLCEVMNPDGTMMRGKALDDFAGKYDLKILSIDDLIAYRLHRENLIEEEVSAELPLEKYGVFEISIVKEKLTQKEHVVLTKNLKDNPLVRIHSSCLTGDIFHSQRCDCHQQLQYALKRVGEEGGILIYLNQEGRGIGLFNKIKAYALQEKGLDTVEANEQLGMPADAREYYLAAAILRKRNIQSIRLLTNNPSKISELEKYGITAVREEMPSFLTPYNQKYLKTKKSKLKHLFNELDE